MVGHARRLSVAFGKDFIQGLSIAFAPLLLQQRIYAREGNVYISPLISASVTDSIISLHQTTTPALSKANSLLSPKEEEIDSEPASDSTELPASDNTEVQEDSEPPVQTPNVITTGHILDSYTPLITLEEDYGWDMYDPTLLNSLVFEQQSPLSSQDAVLECLIRYYTGIFASHTE